MNFSPISTEHLVALYDHYKDRRAAYKERAYQILGGKCSKCGSTNSLRHRFIDPRDSRANRYRTNPVTLFRRICTEPELQNELYLICRECRIANRGLTELLVNQGTPGHKPLENSVNEVKNLDRNS